MEAVFYFYPRSPCGARPMCFLAKIKTLRFLSTLSLRRATRFCDFAYMHRSYFYPRSPCGERHVGIPNANTDKKISIHALLAESDTQIGNSVGDSNISIHALLAESDSMQTSIPVSFYDFYPRSPCGERRLARAAL